MIVMSRYNFSLSSIPEEGFSTVSGEFLLKGDDLSTQDPWAISCGHSLLFLFS
jgi:hypothetical protein